MTLRLVIFIALFALALPAAAQQPSLELFLPADTAGWRLAEQPQSFVGDELFRMIDGGAALYQEYGFDRAASAHYQDSAGRMVDAEIYAMSDAVAAYGMFGITAAAGDRVLSMGDEGEMGEYFLVFRKGRHVVTVSGQNTDRQTMDGVQLLGKEIEARIDSGSQTPGFITNFNGLVQEGTRPIYLRGVVAVGNFYIFAPQNVFNVHEGVTGERDSTRFFVFRYGSSEESARSLSAASQTLKANAKYSDFTSSADHFTATDRDGYVLRASSNGNTIVVVIGQDEDRNKKMEADLNATVKHEEKRR